MASLFKRDTSSLGTVIGVVVVVVAIVGRTFFGWTWSDPSILPLLIGVVAAIAAGWFSVQKMRS